MGHIELRTVMVQPVGEQGPWARKNTGGNVCDLPDTDNNAALGASPSVSLLLAPLRCR